MTGTMQTSAQDARGLPDLRHLDADMRAWRERVLARMTVVAGWALSALIVGAAWWSRVA
jgi:hypothetical protein